MGFLSFRKKSPLKIIVLSGIIMTIVASSIGLTGAPSTASKFSNTEIDYRTSFKDMLAIAKAYFTADRKAAIPENALPVKKISTESLLNDDGNAVYRLGHSTMLINLDKEFILTDPVFSERASPVQWFGPKRFHQAPIDIEQLPDIKAVVISHDHYDHLDKASILALDSKVEKFVTPLKVGDHLRGWGIQNDKIIELDWWQHTSVGGITLTATPAQHFSGRGLFDRDETLWASWVIENRDHKIFFGGDSGYFPGFKEIGERLGPFDITMIETGAYNELWDNIHMLPEQGIQAHIDLKGKAMLPIHNSTFDLALHDWYEPLEKANSLARGKGVNLLTPVFGERITIAKPEKFAMWWREVGDKETLESTFSTGGISVGE